MDLMVNQCTISKQVAMDCGYLTMLGLEMLGMSRVSNLNLGGQPLSFVKKITANVMACLIGTSKKMIPIEELEKTQTTKICLIEGLSLFYYSICNPF